MTKWHYKELLKNFSVDFNPVDTIDNLYIHKH